MRLKAGVSYLIVVNNLGDRHLRMPLDSVESTIDACHSLTLCFLVKANNVFPESNG